jgi:hypothetical protein
VAQAKQTEKVSDTKREVGDMAKPADSKKRKHCQTGQHQTSEKKNSVLRQTQQHFCREPCSLLVVRKDAFKILSFRKNATASTTCQLRKQNRKEKHWQL